MKDRNFEEELYCAVCPYDNDGECMYGEPEVSRGQKPQCEWYEHQ